MDHFNMMKPPRSANYFALIVLSATVIDLLIVEIDPSLQTIIRVGLYAALMAGFVKVVADSIRTPDVEAETLPESTQGG